MAVYKTGLDRNQLILIPTYLEELISKNNPVRVIDAFVDSLDLSNFKYGKPSSKGNKPYNPADLLKLYLFGYKQGIYSSRKLMYQARTNIEFIWLLKDVKPDYRTIADFRKDNADLLKSVFVSFNLSCKELGILSNVVSQDGTKLKAVNSKDKNFTYSKIDDRKKRVLEQINNYLELLRLNDEIENKEILIASMLEAKKN